MMLLKSLADEASYGEKWPHLSPPWLTYSVSQLPACSRTELTVCYCVPPPTVCFNMMLCTGIVFAGVGAAG